MPANYDNAAWFYDRLAALVFGNALTNAQQSLLSYISNDAKILVVGGGTGKILEQLSQVHSSGLNITYVEISHKMAALAKKREVGLNKVEFISLPVEEVSLANNYDVIITSFLFDNFEENMLHHLFNHINAALRQGGVWLNTDFQLTGKWWQSVLLKAMLLFFGVLCDVQSKKLADMGLIFKNAGYELFDSTTFYGDFITSKILVKR